MRDEDDRLVAKLMVALPVGFGLDGQVRSDAGDDVAYVGNSLAKIVVLYPGECRSVLLQDDLEGREGGKVSSTYKVSNLILQRRIVNDLEVALEDLSLGRANLL